MVLLQPPHLYLYTGPESNILDNLSIKMKKFFTIIGDVKIIFRLQDVNFSVNNLWSFFRALNKVLPKNGHLKKVSLLGTLWTKDLSVYKFLGQDLKCESLKFGGWLFFLRIVFKMSITKWNILKSQHMLKPLCSNMHKSSL